MVRALTLIATLLAAALPLAAGASFQVSGPYVIHFNAFTADTLAPSVARHYQIPRSSNRAVLNVVVMKENGGDGSMAHDAIRATIRAEAANLAGQRKSINFRTIDEGNAIYYIAIFPVSNQETVEFNLSITPEGARESIPIVFRQQFFTN